MNRLSKTQFEHKQELALKRLDFVDTSTFYALCSWQFYDLKEFMVNLGFYTHSTQKGKVYWFKDGGLFEPNQFVSLETAVRLYNGTFYTIPFDGLLDDCVKGYLVCYNGNKADTKALIIYNNDLANAMRLKCYFNIDIKWKFDKKDNIYKLTTSKTSDSLSVNTYLESNEYVE